MTLEPVGSGAMTRWVELLAPARQLAEVLAQTDFVPKAMKGRPDAVCAAIMYGDELGLGPMQALGGIDVVEGKPRPSAELLRALILAAGHTFAVHEMTGHKCRVSGLRAGRPEAERVTVEWTLDMARSAGLVNKSNWRSYPRAMLLARASSDLGRLLFPDVLKGLGYMAEDTTTAAEVATWEPAPEPPAPPAKRTPQRRSAPRLPSPGHQLATEDRPGPDGSVDVPLTPEPEATAEPTAEATPELAPHAEPEAEPEAETPALIRPGRLKAVHTLLSVVMGSESSKDERRAVLAAIVGHPVETTKELTAAEGDQALTVLRDVEEARAALVYLDGGTWAVEYANPDEPGPMDGPAPPDPWRVGPDPWTQPGN